MELGRLVMVASLVGGCSGGVEPARDDGVEPAHDGGGIDGMTDDAGTVSVPDVLAVPPDLGTAPPGFPWGSGELVFLAGGAGLGVPVIDANPDEAQNLWAVTPQALYIRRPGDARFRRYTNDDGLHISYGVSAVAGAGPNEGYLGLVGYWDDIPDDDPLDLKRLGKAEHVRLLPDGTISTLHYADLHVDVSANYWETRSTRRFLYGHGGPNAGHLYMAGNHGVTHVFGDRWGDHSHVEVLWRPGKDQCLSEWRGVGLDPVTGQLWMCGRCACGLRDFDPDPRQWVRDPFATAFTVFTANHALEVPHGYVENFVGVSVSPDRTAWFLSALYGLAAWRPPVGGVNIRPHDVPGLGQPVDVAADLDGTVWVADGSRLLRYDPASGQAAPLPVPARGIRRLYLDSSVSPRALYISTDEGLAIYRGK